MWTFQYKHGDRPLDGFTIQRAAGRGGFGEVYYAVSDSGREVALKAVTGYEQIEVRGISQCMNLKSPHLVTIFDVKYNEHGKPFVIMEFVSGPSLRQLLDESPAGLGTQKAAFFLREIGKGLTFLHDCGIVHRDLKPGNIFFENGYVKIGDYGLSKAISPTQHSGQTVTVGTVHYMAPEVGAGKYDRSIDIYAMGAVLYEMLTGTVPFIGASPSEILIKHLQADPDCAGIPEPFCTVIKKAMAKDPAQRYANVQEMVEAVFGAAHVQMSVSHFSPDDLSMVAGRVAQKIALGSPESGAPGSAGIGTTPLGNNSGSSSVIGAETVNSRNPNRFADDTVDGRGWKNVLNQPFEQLRNRMDQLGGKGPVASQPQSETGINDSLSIGTRRMLGLLTAVVVAIAAGTLIDTNKTHIQPIVLTLFAFTAICGATIGLLVGWRRIAIPRLSNESHTVRKFVVGSITCGSMLLLSGFFCIDLIDHGLGGTLLAIVAPLFFFNTWEWVRANRPERVSLSPSIEIAIAGFIVGVICRGNSMLTCAVLAGISLAAQVAAPWDPVLAKRRSDALRSKVRGADKDQREAAVFGNVSTNPAGAEAMQRNGTQVFGNLHIQPPNTPAADPQKPVRPTLAVWQHAPLVWLLVTVLLFSLGLTFVIVGAAGKNDTESAFLIGSGSCALVNSLFCFVRCFRRRYYSIWSYLVRPLLLMACFDLIIIFSVVVATESNGPDIFSVFIIIFFSIALLTVPFLRFEKKIPSTAAVIPPPILVPNAADAAAPSNIPPIPPPIPQMPPMPLMRPFRTSVKNWRQSMRDYRHWQRLHRAQQLRNGKGFLSFLSGWLILLSVATTFAIGLNLPLAVSLNLPNRHAAHEVRSNVSLGVADEDTTSQVEANGVVHPSTWSILLTKLLVLADGVLITAAITTSLIARSGTNLLHLLRVPVGIIGLILATAFMSAKFEGELVWPNVARNLSGNTPHPDQAITAIIDAFQNPATMFAIPLFIACMVILAIRPRNQSKTSPKETA